MQYVTINLRFIAIPVNVAREVVDGFHIFDRYFKYYSMKLYSELNFPPLGRNVFKLKQSLTTTKQICHLAD